MSKRTVSKLVYGDSRRYKAAEIFIKSMFDKHHQTIVLDAETGEVRSMMVYDEDVREVFEKNKQRYIENFYKVSVGGVVDRAEERGRNIEQ